MSGAIVFVLYGLVTLYMVGGVAVMMSAAIGYLAKDDPPRISVTGWVWIFVAWTIYLSAAITGGCDE